MKQALSLCIHSVSGLHWRLFTEPLWAVQGTVVFPLYVLGDAKLLLFCSNAFERDWQALLQHLLMGVCSWSSSFKGWPGDSFFTLSI